MERGHGSENSDSWFSFFSQDTGSKRPNYATYTSKDSATDPSEQYV